MTIRRPSKQFVIDLLRKDPTRSTRDILALVRQQGYLGGYTSLSVFVAVLREELGLPAAAKVANSRRGGRRSPNHWEGLEADLGVLAADDATAKEVA